MTWRFGSVLELIDCTAHPGSLLYPQLHPRVLNTLSETEWKQRSTAQRAQ